MREVDRIDDQLKRAFEGVAWHGPSLKEILAGVTAEQAARRAVPAGHSIWEIVLHIAAWKGAVRRRLEGDYVEDPPEGDWPPVEDVSDRAWEDTLALLERSQQELRAAVARFDEARLHERLAEGRPSAYFTLHGLVQHDLYHAGQIVLLKKA